MKRSLEKTEKTNAGFGGGYRTISPNDNILEEILFS